MNETGLKGRKALGSALAIVAVMLTLVEGLTLALAPFAQIRHGEYPHKIFYEYIQNPWVTWMAILVVGSLLLWLGACRKSGTKQQLWVLLATTAIAIGLATLSLLLEVPASHYE